MITIIENEAPKYKPAFPCIAKCCKCKSKIEISEDDFVHDLEAGGHRFSSSSTIEGGKHLECPICKELGLYVVPKERRIYKGVFDFLLNFWSEL